MKKYINPKTNSEYQVIFESTEYIVCIRKTKDGTNNRRIQVHPMKQSEDIEGLRDCYVGKYSLCEIKELDEKHKYLSITISRMHVHNAIADVVRAIVKYNTIKQGDKSIY
jgi:hypothetical protein